MVRGRLPGEAQASAQGPAEGPQEDQARGPPPRHQHQGFSAPVQPGLGLRRLRGGPASGGHLTGVPAGRGSPEQWVVCLSSSFVPWDILAGFLCDANHIRDLASKQRKRGAANRLGGEGVSGQRAPRTGSPSCCRACCPRCCRSRGRWRTTAWGGPVGQDRSRSGSGHMPVGEAAAGPSGRPAPVEARCCLFQKVQGREEVRPGAYIAPQRPAYSRTFWEAYSAASGARPLIATPQAAFPAFPTSPFPVPNPGRL